MTRDERTGRPVVVLACGESLRGDDAVALTAADLLEREGLAGVVVRRAGGLEPGHLLDVPEGAACVVVDCVVGIPAGRVVVLPLADLAAGGAGRSRSASASTHLLPLGDVVALAGVLLGDLPPGSFVGLGGERFGLGEPPSPAVQEALPEFVRAIVGEIAALRGSRPAA